MNQIKKFLIENKVIALIITIAIVLVTVSVAVIAGRSGKGNDSSLKRAGPELSASDSERESSTREQFETMLVEEEVTKEESAELETSADGSVSAVTTEDGSKIDLSSADVQKETSADGSTTYKMADGSQVVVDSNGSAKVIKTETVTKVVQNTTNQPVSLADSSSSSQADAQVTTSNPASSSSAASEQVTAPASTTAPTSTPAQSTTQTPTQPATEAPTQAPTQPATEAPTQAPTQPATEVPTQPETTFTPVCYHDVEYLHKRITTPATESSYGAWEQYCDNCGKILETGSIHPYSAYQVDLGNGNTATVYGYYDDAVADEIYNQLNAYRLENSLQTLERTFIAESNTRAMELAYSFSHIRPNGQDYDLTPYMLGENIAMIQNLGGTSFSKAGGFMSRWKNSPLHNSNMLDSDYTMCGIGVFVKLTFDSDGIPITDAIETYAVQNFGFEW